MTTKRGTRDRVPLAAAECDEVVEAVLDAARPARNTDAEATTGRTPRSSTTAIVVT
jgi:hypothetical protein